MDISFFSVGIVVLHFMTNIQVALFKKRFIPQDERAEKLQATTLKVFDFMRQKLLYIMCTLTQIDIIWNNNFKL